ncbi:MAG: malonyl-ACP O-methyltransferase BioC [Nitrosospira sp.]|nr:malonyl-ACP O-methyltransferase BioC [Nitrosospira sp.]
MNYDHFIDKRQLRRSFERAAAGYDQAAVLQHEVCNRMLSRLDYIKYIPDTLLDAGSGTGYGNRKLVMRYPSVRVIAIDIAMAMHSQARSLIPWWKRLPPFYESNINYICGDIEQLPLKDSGIGMVWSNLTLQWCDNIKQTFSEVRRVLKTDGLFMFSTLGPDTLKEFRQVFSGVDKYRHTNRFTDMHDIGDLLAHNGFSAPVMDMEYITLTYDDVVSAMRDLKAIGAHNIADGRQRGLTGKNGWRRAVESYETFRIEGKLPVTFEVIYGHAWK